MIKWAEEFRRGWWGTSQPSHIFSACSYSAAPIVSWQSNFAAVGAAEFSVELKPESDAKAAFVEAYRGPELKRECDKLTADTAYLIRVRVRDNRGALTRGVSVDRVLRQCDANRQPVARSVRAHDRRFHRPRCHA